MKEQDIIIAIAELDGASNIRMSTRWECTDPPQEPKVLIAEWGNLKNKYPIPPYLTSRDAIVPVIEKQTYTTKARIIRSLQPEIEWDIFGVSDRVVIQELESLLLAPPSQLCEALLRATNKWKE